MVPLTGADVYVGRDASVQFSGVAAITFQVIQVDSRTTDEGWLWLSGYQLDRFRRPVERRAIFVRAAGLVLVEQSPEGQRPRSRNAGPVRAAGEPMRPRSARRGRPDGR